MRIAILGTRGIPNHYGGFEQCAEYLALGLVKKGHEVIVYNSHNHPYQESEWNNVKIIHIHDPEYKMGTIGQFIYDYKCIKDVKNQNCDIILQLGYSSSSVSGWLLPKDVIVTTNMDGLEWKRSKYSNNVRKFLLYAEKLAVRYSDHLISDSIGIQEYLKDKYNQNSTYIPYGANLFENPDKAILDEFHLTEFNYDLLIARLEPENSIEIILDGVVTAGQERPFLVIGNHKTKYGEYLKKKYEGSASIKFLGGIYDINKLNNIRFYSNLYFHGHTVGGTNPSLLEAMASGSFVVANDNPFNRHILGDEALYFNTPEEVTTHLLSVSKLDPHFMSFVKKNEQKIKDIYSWETITSSYEAHFNKIKEDKRRFAMKMSTKFVNNY
jgi:glycosyltransferase involved in cell wall biosynthesis